MFDRFVKGFKDDRMRISELRKELFSDALQKRCSSTLSKFHRLFPEPLFNEIAGLQPV